MNNNTTVVHDKTKSEDYLLGKKPRISTLKLSGFHEWDKTKDPRPLTIQTTDKTMVKPGDVVRNWEHEMGQLLHGAITLQ